jgi:hypothetical protein
MGTFVICPSATNFSYEFLTIRSHSILARRMESATLPAIRGDVGMMFSSLAVRTAQMIAAATRIAVFSLGLSSCTVKW